jgi:phasin family protein
MTEAEKITPEITPAPAPKAKPAAKGAPKTTSQVKDAFAMPAIEMPEAFRDMSEKSAKQVKEGYEKMRVAAEEATDLIEDQFETARGGMISLNAKALETAKASADASFKFASEILAAKTFSDVIALQTAYSREQFELMSSSMKEMQELFLKVANEVGEPVKGAFEKAVKDFKTAA